MSSNHYVKARQVGVTLLELSVVLLVLIALAGLTVPYVSGVGRTAACQATDATMQTVKEAIMGGASGSGYYADTLGHYPQDLAGLTANTPVNYNLRYLFISSNSDGSRKHQFFNPGTGVGWRGPYLMNGVTLVNASGNLVDSNYSHSLANGDMVVNDAWGRPLVLQVPDGDTCDKLTNSLNTEQGYCARLVSTGPGDGVGIGAGDIDTPINDDPATGSTNEAQRNGDDRILYLRIPMPADDKNVSCSDL